MLFGFMAQRSRFCLRSAVIEFARNHMGGKLTVWLFAFATALGATQALAWAGWLDAGNARQIATRGSLSGAAVGGALFGVGMILARGCASRLLVLSAQGSLRSLLSGLIFALTAAARATSSRAPASATAARCCSRWCGCWRPSPGRGASRCGSRCAPCGRPWR
jgi:uncharacterized membrane protein YedE/YeeE